MLSFLFVDCVSKPVPHCTNCEEQNFQLLSCQTRPGNSLRSAQLSCDSPYLNQLHVWLGRLYPDSFFIASKGENHLLPRSTFHCYKLTSLGGKIGNKVLQQMHRSFKHSFFVIFGCFTSLGSPYTSLFGLL